MPLLRCVPGVVGNILCTTCCYPRTQGMRLHLLEKAKASAGGTKRRSSRRSHSRVASRNRDGSFESPSVARRRSTSFERGSDDGAGGGTLLTEVQVCGTVFCSFGDIAKHKTLSSALLQWAAAPRGSGWERGVPSVIIALAIFRY